MAVVRSLIGQGSAVEFNYQKSPSYRSVHVDGAIASNTTRGLLTISFYNERPVIPRRVRQPITGETNGTFTLGDEEVLESLDGILRQLEFTMFMDWEVARQLRDVLNRMLEAAVVPNESTESTEG